MYIHSGISNLGAITIRIQIYFRTQIGPPRTRDLQGANTTATTPLLCFPDLATSKRPEPDPNVLDGDTVGDASIWGLGASNPTGEREERRLYTPGG